MDESTDFLHQAAAIPVKGHRVCLVTSTNRKRWVIPKGIIDPGHTAGQAALQEAWEEAGLAGTLAKEPVGSYLYEKWGRVCHVTVFLMQVTGVSEEWPERQVRQRAWVSFDDALERVQDRGLREVMATALTVGQRGA
jgi:8-oxo-dGTP pyrophosphatase MutT (NUDIX family)